MLATEVHLLLGLTGQQKTLFSFLVKSQGTIWLLLVFFQV